MSDETEARSLSYKDAGVDIDAGNALVKRIGDTVKRTHRPGVVTGLGGFGGLFDLDLARFPDPILVSGTDGVGTKLLLARELGRHDTIGIDLVAMCVNDIVVTGAEPLFFLDYFATGALDISAAAEVISGIGHGCELAGCALIGGETAEMPGMYAPGDYDLAGFAVGAVSRSALIDNARVQVGDIVIGLASSGPHSNGYSLIRKVLERYDGSLADTFDGDTLGDALLAPTRIYVKALLALAAAIDVRAIAHITGGGLSENLPRVLPDGTAVQLSLAPSMPPVFDWLQRVGNIETHEMRRTFNCGIGMTVIVGANDVDAALDVLTAQGESASIIGEVIAGDGAVSYR
ncbi:MAG: phosphoribosylformylglycinamidine cyclo-ligase [Pseudomonadota bacterium]